MTTPKKPRRMARAPLPADATIGTAKAQAAADDCSPSASRATKQSLVIELLERDGGASLADIVATTGWLPHTARAALTGLRKRGHAILRHKVAGETRYLIAPLGEA